MKNKRMTSCVLIVLISILVSGMFQMDESLTSVAAQVNDIEYIYDAAGRLIMVTYSDGEQIQYEYDANGNIITNKVIQSTIENNEKADKVDEVVWKDDNEHNDKQPIAWGTGFVSIRTEMRTVGILYETPQDKQAYKKFKKKKPIIKAIKQIKKKNKLYLKIQVRKISGLGNYKENGYEIKYATNKKFKEAKTLQFAKKGSVTGKQWSVKKGGTYWVKVRAYMKTKKGKTIYSKYSKSVKIKVN